jgi:hypothetical protein
VLAGIGRGQVVPSLSDELLALGVDRALDEFSETPR